mmetsp:Transcript_13708/g.48387  ORF Transcript_13708/g.48387 Transcript_13708/m.48387 type:complete len:262 (-) Transcript_13708:706-1491(-)
MQTSPCSVGATLVSDEPGLHIAGFRSHQAHELVRPASRPAQATADVPPVRVDTVSCGATSHQASRATCGCAQAEAGAAADGRTDGDGEAEGEERGEHAAGRPDGATTDEAHGAAADADDDGATSSGGGGDLGLAVLGGLEEVCPEFGGLRLGAFRSTHRHHARARHGLGGRLRQLEDPAPGDVHGIDGADLQVACGLERPGPQAGARRCSIAFHVDDAVLQVRAVDVGCRTCSPTADEAAGAAHESARGHAEAAPDDRAYR